MFEELDDFEVDFDKADIPEGEYMADIESVTFRVAPKKADPTVISKNMNITYKLITDDEFNGQFVYGSVWFGSSEKEMLPMNIKQFKSFVKAALGVDPAGAVKLSEYGPEKDEKNNTHLTDLEGHTVMIVVVHETGDDGIERVKVKSVSAASKGSWNHDDDPV